MHRWASQLLFLEASSKKVLRGAELLAPDP